MKSKITILFISFFYCSQFVNAQITKGSILLGGAASFSHTDYHYVPNNINDQIGNGGNIYISGGKAVSENSVTGVNLQFGSANYSYNGSLAQKQKSINYGAGVFYRKYKTLAKDFYFFLEGDLGYSYSRQKQIDSTGNELSKNTQFSVALSLLPGISYKVLKNLNLEVTLPNMFSLQYSDAKINNGTSAPPSKSNYIGFTSNLNASLLQNLFVGFRLIF
ncbi:MAG: hypothetical protein ABI267_04965 [Ginsengibacter sp.]